MTACRLYTPLPPTFRLVPELELALLLRPPKGLSKKFPKPKENGNSIPPAGRAPQQLSDESEEEEEEGGRRIAGVYIPLRRFPSARLNVSVHV